MKRFGKKAQKWAETRKQWFIDHPAISYQCHYCGGWMDKQNTTLDHENNRNHDGRLLPACWLCNGKKGSISHERYQHICHE